MIKEAYKLGQRMYLTHGYKPNSASPFPLGSDEHNSFERGMTQAYNLNPGVDTSNELEDKAEAEAVAQEAKIKQQADDEKRKRKRQAYINATKAG